jgi:hypothetical protein
MTEPAVARRSLAAARAIDLDASERDAVLPDLQRAAELEADLA